MTCPQEQPLFVSELNLLLYLKFVILMPLVSCCTRLVTHSELVSVWPFVMSLYLLFIMQHVSSSCFVFQDVQALQEPHTR